jgi:hypothetical protein
MIKEAQKIALTPSTWNTIRQRATKELRSISNQIEYDLLERYKKESKEE